MAQLLQQLAPDLLGNLLRILIFVTNPIHQERVCSSIIVTSAVPSLHYTSNAQDDCL